MSSTKQTKKSVRIKEEDKGVKVTQGNNEIYVINEEDVEEHEALMQIIDETLGDQIDLKNKINAVKNDKQGQIEPQPIVQNQVQKTTKSEAKPTGKNETQSNVKGSNFQQGQIGMYKENEEKLRKEIKTLKAEISTMKEQVNKAKAEASKSQKILSGVQDTQKNLESALDKREEEIRQQQQKINSLNLRNKELEKMSVDVNRQSDQLYKDKKNMETLKDKLNIQITDLTSRCEILKNENKNITDIMQQKNKESNLKINEHLLRIQELSSEIADLKQEMKDYEVRYQKEKAAKDELRIQLKMHEIAVSENEELKKKLAKKEDKLEELEDLVDQLKTKLRKFDTSLTVKDQYGQVKEYRSEKYSDLLDQRSQDQITSLQKEVSQLSQGMTDFRNNNYKIESEKEALRVENASLKEEVKRLERNRLKDQNEYESEVRDKLRTLENQRIKINNLQEQNSELDKARVTKLEAFLNTKAERFIEPVLKQQIFYLKQLLRDSEFQKIEIELSQSKNKIQQLENLNQQMQYKLDHLEQINNKKQLMIGDMHFQNETLKEEVQYLTNLKQNNSRAKVTHNLPLKNKENEILIVEPQIIQSDKRIQEQLSPRYSLIDQQRQQMNVKQHSYEMPHEMSGMQAQMLSSPSHYERDNYANFYRDTRQMMDSLNKYQSTSTVASQNQYSYY